MALVLSLRIGEGFALIDPDGSRRVVRLVSVPSYGRLVVETPDGARHLLSDERAAEVLPGVMVHVGDNASAGMARVAIDAPREVKISRVQDQEAAS